jgi:ABC-type Fe3+-siderophore transport system permease subunit
MSTAAMNSVAPEKAGVGSGILSMSRMVGSTFGVAVIGALFQHLARNELADKLSGTGVTAGQREQLVHSLGAGSQSGEPLPPAVVSASHDAFVHAFANGMWLSASVAGLGALVAFWLIAPKTAKQPDPARLPEAAAEAISAS